MNHQHRRGYFRNLVNAEDVNQKKKKEEEQEQEEKQPHVSSVIKYTGVFFKVFGGKSWNILLRRSAVMENVHNTDSEKPLQGITER